MKDMTAPKGAPLPVENGKGPQAAPVRPPRMQSMYVSTGVVPGPSPLLVEENHTPVTPETPLLPRDQRPAFAVRSQAHPPSLVRHSSRMTGLWGNSENIPKRTSPAADGGASPPETPVMIARPPARKPAPAPKKIDEPETPRMEYVARPQPKPAPLSAAVDEQPPETPLMNIARPPRKPAAPPRAAVDDQPPETPLMNIARPQGKPAAPSRAAFPENTTSTELVGTERTKQNGPSIETIHDTNCGPSLPAQHRIAPAAPREADGAAGADDAVASPAKPGSTGLGGGAFFNRARGAAQSDEGKTAAGLPPILTQDKDQGRPQPIVVKPVRPVADPPVTKVAFSEEKKKKAGEGSLGVVYMRQVIISRDGINKEVGAVVKVPKNPGWNYLRSFNQEARVLYHLRGTLGIVPYLAVCPYDRFPDPDGSPRRGLVLQRLDYSLQGYVELHKDSIQPETLYQIATTAAWGMWNLHKIGLTHNDIKPGNILLKKKNACLADLGGAQLITVGSLPAESTPSYSAPEIRWGQANQYSTPADLFSFGCTIAFLLTGTTLGPIDQTDDCRKQEKIQQATAKGFASDPLFSLMMQCWNCKNMRGELDPELRISTLQCVLYLLTARYAMDTRVAPTLLNFQTQSPEEIIAILNPILKHTFPDWEPTEDPVTWRCPSGDSLLHLAAALGSLRSVKILLAEPYKMDIDLLNKQNGNTPIIVAATQRQLDLYEYLLRNGANPCWENNFNLSARAVINFGIPERFSIYNHSFRLRAVTEEEIKRRLRAEGGAEGGASAAPTAVDSEDGAVTEEEIQRRLRAEGGAEGGASAAPTAVDSEGGAAAGASGCSGADEDVSRIGFRK